MNISEQIIAKISNTLGNEIKSLEKKLKLQLEKTLKLQRTVATKNNPMLTQSDAFYRSLKKSQEIRDEISKLLVRQRIQPNPRKVDDEIRLLAKKVKQPNLKVDKLDNQIKSLEKKLKSQFKKTLKLQNTNSPTKSKPLLTQSDAFFSSLKKSQEIRDKISKLLAKKVSQPNPKAELAAKTRQKQREGEARITSTTFERERKRNFRTVDTLFKNR